MRPYFRYLRITWTVLCVIACVLLCALWIRSYWLVDIAYFQFRRTPTVGFMSVQGRAVLGVEEPGTAGTQFGITSVSITSAPPIIDEFPVAATRLGFGAKLNRIGREILVPLYFMVLLSATFAAVPWIHWKRRFSVRTLLIAITAVATVLGVIVWLMR